MREALANQITRLDLKQHDKLGNPIPQEEVAKELAACHVFVMPCRMDPKAGNFDGIPTVFMEEAMACGRAVVATDAGEVPHLIDNGKTGFVVPREDEAALTSRITTRLADRELCRQMGDAGRIKAERAFGIERLRSETFVVYRAEGWKDM